VVFKTTKVQALAQDLRGYIADLGFLAVSGLVLLVMITYWVRWVGLFERAPRIDENLRRLRPTIPFLLFWALYLDLNHASISSLIPVTAIVFGFFVLLMLVYSFYLRRPGAATQKRAAGSVPILSQATSTHRSSLLLTRRFFGLTSKFGAADDDVIDIPDATQLSQSSMATRVSLELGLMSRWAGTTVAIAAAMVAISYIAHLFSKQAEHYAFYPFVALLSFCAAGMFVNALRYIVAWLTEHRTYMRERANFQDAGQADSSVMYWLTTPRDSDFFLQFVVAGLIVFGLARNGA
jgi:hypothetical protein